MPALLAMLLPALIPTASDAIRGLVARWTGGAGAKPQNVAEAISMMEADTKRLQALAELDRPSGEISRWVANLRASFRYIAAGLFILVACATIFIPGIPSEYVDMVWLGAGSVWAFIFGDRMNMQMRRK